MARYYQTAYNYNGCGGMAYYSSETCDYNKSELVTTGCTNDYAESDIKFKVHYDFNNDNKYIKSRLDYVEVCSCNGAYKQYSTDYENMDNEIEE